MTESNSSAMQILASVDAAIAALPYPFCIFDKNETAILASDEFKRAFSELLPDDERPLYELNVTIEDITRAKLESTLPSDQVDSKLALELRKFRETGASTKDIMLSGKWARRIKAVSPEGHKVTLAVPIEELVQRARDLVEAKQEMEHQALHDPLTDLPNRRALNAYLEQVIGKNDVAGEIVVFHVDLDKFKLVNDTLGHDAGDCVLLEASKILRSEVRATDFVARVGGDEFVMVFTSLNDREGVSRVAQRIVERMREPIYYDDQCCQIGASVGIAVCEEFTTPERIIMDADIALYEAKLAGRGRFSFFNSVHRAQHTAFKKRVFEVREAIMMNAFEPFFQPQVCAKTGAMIGFEAVARWQDLETGIRQPSEFIAAVEEANLMVELDEMIIKKAIRRLQDWDADGVKVPKISVNIGSGLLGKPDLAEELRWICEEANIAPERLGLELLENVVGQDQTGTITTNVAHLKSVGFQIALDDFGTGNASISSLRRLAPHQINIAREFITNIQDDAETRTITAAIISLAQQLGMKFLAKGVETLAERNVLEELGADYCQGFLFAKPMESDFVPIWIEDYHEDILPELKLAAR